MRNAVRSASSSKRRLCLVDDDSLPPRKHLLLAPYQTFDWKPDESLTADENFMDLTLILTRSSQLKQGGMACILVRNNSSSASPTTSTDHAVPQPPPEDLLERILSVSTNQSLFRVGDSDIHAEIAALGQAAQAGLATADCTAYITMPPCKTCFGALYAAGVKRIVSRHTPNQPWLQKAAEQHNVQVLGMDDALQQRARVDAIVQRYYNMKESSKEDAMLCSSAAKDDEPP